MHSTALPIVVERHLPLLPMGLVSPACCWASIDDDLNYIFHIANGRGTVSTDSGVIRFCAPCAVIVPSGEAHNFQFELSASGMALTITGEYLGRLVAREPDFAMLFTSPVIVPLVSEQLTWPLARLAHELAGSDVAHTAAADSHLLSILVQCARALEHSRAIQAAHPKAATTLVTRLRELIEQHYRDNITLAQYSTTLGVTQTRLREACLMVTGMLPNQLIQQRILLEAQRALLNSTMTIAQTAYYLGFNDPAYFSRFFTKAMGQSPRMYRERPKSN
ncbi:MAG TPA: helix-turn-helix domain-containing protein [Rhizomicrobium sp.]|nr:helix-turn-helix domain-containing protein [Rhizomicrobium sp.]